MKIKSLIIILLLIANFSYGQHLEIHKVAEAGKLDKVKELLEADSTLLELKDGAGYTPLHKACKKKQVAVAKFLIDKGADVNVKNNYGNTPLIGACRGWNKDIVLVQYLIIRGADVNAHPNRGLTALHFAAMASDLKVARLLINHGADINAYDNYYGTVLHTAIHVPEGMKKEEISILLIESGAILNQKFSYGNTEIHLAATKGFTEVIPVLAKHGADVNAVNNYNHTALYYAAKLGYRSIVEALIAAGANKNSIVETNYGKAPQLTETLNEGEAYLWYLNGIWHGGYAVKTKEHLLIFDKTGIDESAEAGLANGKLNPKELAGQKITALIAKPLFGTHKTGFLEMAKRMPDIDWILESKQTTQDTNNLSLPPFRVVSPNESFSVGGIKVHTIPALACDYGGPKGLGYLVEADGVKIFYAGFHASLNQPEQLKRYRKEIDFLKAFGPIDIAIITVKGHVWGVSYEPYLYLLDQLKPKAIYLMGNHISEEYPKCAEVLRVRNIPVEYPEGGIAVGQRFHYTRD